MGRALTVVGAIIIILGGAAIGYAVTRDASHGMSEAQHAAMIRAVDQLDGGIEVARAQVQERATSLSQQPVVRGAVATDLDTVNDLVRGGELSFSPAEGEIIEIGQVDPAGGAVKLLLRVPAGAMQIAHDGRPGQHVELVDGQLVIIEIARVEPNRTPAGTGISASGSGSRADLSTGFLAVSRQLALAPKLKPLLDAGVTGKLIINGKEAAIGAMPAGAVTHELPLRLPGAKIVGAEPMRQAAMPLPILIGGIGAAAIGLLLLVISVMGRRDAQTSTFPVGTPTPPLPSTGIGNAETQLSQSSVAAAGTPFAIDAAARSQIMPSNLGAGAVIGRWEVLRRLGSGGMADVYLAQARGDGGFEKLVAIKVMHSHLARTQRAVDHFLDEARLAARIHHPNVVAIQDLGKIGDDYVIVMEYVDGVDLERLLSSARAGERQLPLGVGLGILCRICDGLDAAHRATSPDGTPLGIVHRDVKSANVLVSRQGSVKVVDFGIAKAANQVHYTAIGETKGTPSMMAPEQRVGEKVDVRADVYSAAAVGYEIVTGRGVNLDLAALAHLGIENWPHLPLPSSMRANLPPELDEILLHAMAFERDKRPANCAELEAQCAAVMKTHNLGASDKDIARWIESELRFLGPAYDGPMLDISKSPVA